MQEERDNCLYANEKELVDIMRYMPPGHIVRENVLKIGTFKLGWKCEENNVFNKDKKHICNV